MLARFLAKLICTLFGHRYEVWQVFSSVERRVICDDCGGDWAMHDGHMAFVPWDKDFEELKTWRGVKIRPRRQQDRVKGD